MKQINGMKLLAGAGVLLALFVLVSLTACVPLVQKKSDSVDPIRNTREFGRVLGCVAAPNTCPPNENQKSQDEQKFIKEFERIDQELSKETAPSTLK